MIGTKFYKNDYKPEDYADCAVWCNENGAKIVDKGDYYEAVAIPEPTAEEKLEAAKSQAEATIRAKLAETDYKCLKFVDGELTAEEYAETKAERQRLRKLFNVVEACESLADVQSITNNI